MKYLLILLLTFSIFYANNSVKAQISNKTDESSKKPVQELPSSIVYTDNVFGQKMNKKSKFPADLSVKSLYYIEIKPEDVKFSEGMMALQYDDINKKLLNGMKNYPYKFQSFNNEYSTKDNQYFLDKGFKYRLIIHTIFEAYRYDGHTEYKERFSVKILDIEKNIVYGTDDWYWHYNYVGKFLKKI